MTLRSLYAEVAYSYPSPSSLEKSFEFDGVYYDQQNGLGNVPYNQDVHYKGFTCLMRPNQFLGLSKRLSYNSLPEDHGLVQAIRAKESIGSPFLIMDLEDGVNQIADHEGRHRTIAIRQVLGAHTRIVVQILFRGKRARNVDNARLSEIRMSIKPQGLSIDLSGPHFDDRVCHLNEWKKI